MWVHVAPYGVILTFQIRKASFDSFSAVSTNFAILQILRNTGRPPAYNGIETFSIRAKNKPFSKIAKSSAAAYPPPKTARIPEISPNPSRARAREKNKSPPQNVTDPPENWTTNTRPPHQMIPQSYFRYEPISPTYDPNEFVKNYNKESHQNFANFDRPEKGRINEFLNSFFEIG